MVHRVVTHITEDLPDSQTRLKASRYVAEISAMWNAMSDEQKATSTSESLKRLEEYRENKSSGYHNSAASAFKDTQATLLSIKREVDILNSRLINSLTFTFSSIRYTIVPARSSCYWRCGPKVINTFNHLQPPVLASKTSLHSRCTSPCLTW